MIKLFTDNRKAGAAALVVSALILLFFGTYRTTESLRRDVIEEYHASRADSDTAVLLDSASQIGVIWQAVMGADETSETFDALYLAADTDYPIASGNALSELTSHSAVMYNTLVAEEKMTDAQQITAKRYYYDMLNAWTMLRENEGYRALAAKYNDAVSHFPASIFAKQNAALFG